VLPSGQPLGWQQPRVTTSRFGLGETPAGEAPDETPPKSSSALWRAVGRGPVLHLCVGWQWYQVDVRELE